MSEPKLTYHEVDDKMVIHYAQDVEPTLEMAKRARREDAERFGAKSELRRTMRIPNNIWLQVCAKLGIPFGECFQSEHQKRIMAELKSSEYAAFRTVNDVKI